MKQSEFYESIKKWLEGYGFKVVVTGGKSRVTIPIWDILPLKSHLIPDLIGMRDNQVTIVEVEIDLNKVVEVIGKCMIWKTTASLVYAAYPLKKCQKLKILEKLGIGLLGVSREEVKEIVKIMPKESLDLHKVYELHPLDFAKEMELVRSIRNIIEEEEIK